MFPFFKSDLVVYQILLLLLIVLIVLNVNNACIYCTNWFLISREMSSSSNHGLVYIIGWYAHVICMVFLDSRYHYTPRTTKLLGGILVSLRPSVRLSVRPSRLPCPLCNIFSSGWILSILATNDHYHERVCRTQWPLTLTYIFKVIRPWLRKSGPLCSVYSSGWIIFIFGANDHYHSRVCRVLRFFQNLKIFQPCPWKNIYSSR